jgi:hypothetical protein
VLNLFPDEVIVYWGNNVKSFVLGDVVEILR